VPSLAHFCLERLLLSGNPSTGFRFMKWRVDFGHPPPESPPLLAEPEAAATATGLAGVTAGTAEAAAGAPAAEAAPFAGEAGAAEPFASGIAFAVGAAPCPHAGVTAAPNTTQRIVRSNTRGNAVLPIGCTSGSSTINAGCKVRLPSAANVT
jgi:hypothetical protein